MGMITLSTASLTLTYSEENGILCGIAAPETGWEILNRPGRGLSWRFMLPLSEELRNNDILGEKQTLTSCRAEADKVVFTWKNVHSERGGVHEIAVTLTVRAVGRQAVYEMSIENNSPYTVENVYCPYIADIAPPKDARWLKTFGFSYCGSNELDIWPRFSNTTGYFGTDYPTIIYNEYSTPSAPFVLLRAENQGLYMGVHAPSVEYVAWFGELRPGYESTIDARVPEGDEIAGKPVEKRFAALHTPFILPGESRALTPIALEAYQGGWQKGADIYKAWRKTWMKPAAAPAWARDVHSWQQLHINSPEDELRLRFTELPRVAETCKKYGVKAIQLVGWNDGGQDQGNPSHSPDSRLGTWDELRDAIAQCHEIGVKIILFTKFTWADRGTKWFRDELHRYAVKDPYGDYYMHQGYLYQTGTQLLDLNTKRLVPMCFANEAYMRICEQEFKKVVALGAAGMLYDECQHHSPTHLCFDKSHGHRVPWPTYANDRVLIERLRRTEGLDSEFLMAGEACYDWEMEAYQLAYYRTESKTHVPLARYLLPEAQYMTAITGFRERNMINQCLMFRFVISYEPYHFKGSMDDYPETMEYGMKMDALRTEYRAWFWDGEFISTCGAEVTGAGGAAHPTYSVFRASDGSLGAVACNYEDAKVTLAIKGTGETAFTRYRLVDCGEWKSVADGIEIPARSAAIVL